MRSLPLSALACAFLAAAPTFVTAGAQRLAGAVVLADGRTPAPGTIVVARDSAGHDVGYAVAGATGGFAFFVDSTQPLSFVAERVGLAATPLFTRRFRDGERDSVTVTLSADALTLPTKVPRGASTCGGRGDGRTAVESLLGEARKVLLASRYRIGRPDAVARTTAFQHRTAKNGLDTLYTMMRREVGTPPPLFEEVPAEELERRGFFATVNGERHFAPLGHETLLSAWFAETHCFKLDRADDQELVVEFAPSRERKGLVDVEGTYRFDRATGGLREVTFRYQNLPREERHSEAGGAIEFARASNGEWVATRWHQRFPLLGYRSSSGATTFVESKMTLVDITGHRVVGGRVNAILGGARPVFQVDPLPPLRSEFAALCPERVVSAQTAAAMGRIAAEDSLPVYRLAVRASWKTLVVVDRTQMTEREHVRETLTGPDGEWALCDLPVDRDVMLVWNIRGKDVIKTIKLTKGGVIERM